MSSGGRFPHRAKALLYLVGLAGVVLSAGCMGWLKIHGTTQTRYAYVATGNAIAQYMVTINGLLVPLSTASVSATNPVAICATHDAKFVYAAEKSANDVLQYSTGIAGTLTPLSPATVHTGTHPVAIAVTPNGQFVYVLNHDDNTISQFGAATDGTLLPLSPATVAVANDGDSLVISPNGNFLYATSYTSGKVSAYSIGGTGQLAPLTVATYDVTSPTGPAISPNGNFLYVPASVAGVAQFSIAVDGSLTPLTPPTVPTPGAGNDTAAVTPDGNSVYIGVFNGGNPGSPVAQFSVNVDGTLTALVPASVAAGNAPQFVDVEPDGKFAYVANGNDGTVSQFSIGGNGTLSALSPATVNPAGALQIAFVKK
ncbi:MAG: lactonase family protein [Fimbriimonadales bacterium]